MRPHSFQVGGNRGQIPIKPSGESASAAQQTEFQRKSLLALVAIAETAIKYIAAVFDLAIAARR